MRVRGETGTRRTGWTRRVENWTLVTLPLAQSIRRKAHLGPRQRGGPDLSPPGRNQHLLATALQHPPQSPAWHEVHACNCAAVAAHQSPRQPVSDLPAHIRQGTRVHSHQAAKSAGGGRAVCLN
jgi:hypothetical protein